MPFLTRAFRLMGILSAALLPIVAWTWGWRAAIGLAGGMLWALANVWVNGMLVKPIGSPQRRRWWKTASLVALKVPVLYVIGAALLLGSWSSPIGFVVGFSLWFVALGLGALRGVAA
ncbi:MAG: hypothetical protein HYY90_04170 [Candidatus Omnitrophica bacterium]|nr:hypothetical protein [Candidatus Omnitrophota bacterium]MBI3083540.1 hypothetical protein [Candidatus Omnitrophota bacterium]